MMEERLGKLAVVNLFSSIWLGEWDQYEKIMSEIPETVMAEFSFHSLYDRKEVELWYDNHFFIPGDHFVSPYFSSYSLRSDDEEVRKKDLLCLIGLYEKTGFLYPLEVNRFPDHFGCLTAYLSSVLQEQVKAFQEQDLIYVKQLEELEKDFLKQYIQPVIEPLLKEANKKGLHSFFKQFLSFYTDIINTI